MYMLGFNKVLLFCNTHANQYHHFVLSSRPHIHTVDKSKKVRLNSKKTNCVDVKLYVVRVAGYKKAHHSLIPATISICFFLSQLITHLSHI